MWGPICADRRFLRTNTMYIIKCADWKCVNWAVVCMRSCNRVKNFVCCSLVFVSWICPFCLNCGPSTSRYKSSANSCRTKRIMLPFPHHLLPQQMRGKNSTHLCGIVPLFQEDFHYLQCQNSIVCPVAHRSLVSSTETCEHKLKPLTLRLKIGEFFETSVFLTYLTV
jgi:hypothetical protein